MNICTNGFFYLRILRSNDNEITFAAIVHTKILYCDKWETFSLVTGFEAIGNCPNNNNIFSVITSFYLVLLA